MKLLLLPDAKLSFWRINDFIAMPGMKMDKGLFNLATIIFSTVPNSVFSPPCVLQIYQTSTPSGYILSVLVDN